MDTDRLTGPASAPDNVPPNAATDPASAGAGHRPHPPPHDQQPRIIPVCVQFRQDAVACNSPEAVFRRFRDCASFILESAYGEHKTAKYSLIGVHPVLRITAENGNRTVISGLKEYVRALVPLFADDHSCCGTPASISPEDGKAGGSPAGASGAPPVAFGNAAATGRRLPGAPEMVTVTATVPDPVARIHRVPDLFGYHDDAIPGYQAGLTGFFSYDLVYSLFPTVTTEQPALPFPLADFVMTSEYILFDHPEGEMYVFSLALVDGEDDGREATRNARQTVEHIIGTLNDAPEEHDHDGIAGSGTTRGDARGQGAAASKQQPDARGDIRVKAADVGAPACTENIPKDGYEDLVRKTKEYIFSGDIFQGVISRQLCCGYDGDPFAIYAALRQINPGPYMYYITYGERQIIGSSPEMLVKVEKNRVTTVPIAGTRPRGATPEEDRRLEEELLSDAKECAEHLMLVDLARNDIGRVAEYGTVQMDEFMKVGKFSHVQHIVSTVSGTLDAGHTPADAFTSCFPAGTLTGAPKIRAMQILAELEPCRRGLYGGAVGHIGLDGKVDFAIAIRTLVCEGGALTFQNGAGIVADSDPETEYHETEKKASAIAHAIAIAQGGGLP
ncbi:MAG TPA: anthranilate synthase component I family protein [Methanoculleus sp.]|nr:anthranilate synthase component I family protein [Methanoculleus sp.]